MKKPIAKLREDVVKAAMRLYSCERGVMSSKQAWEKFMNAEAAFYKACAALASRQKRGVK